MICGLLNCPIANDLERLSKSLLTVAYISGDLTKANIADDLECPLSDLFDKNCDISETLQDGDVVAVGDTSF